VQQRSPAGQPSVATLHTPASHTSREQVVVPPPAIAAGVGPPVVATVQSLSLQHWAHVPVLGQQSLAVGSLQSVFEQQS
jgi:hypothetical protein